MLKGIVYHTEGCQKCRLTAKQLEPMEVELRLIDRKSKTNMPIIGYMESKGLMSAPLVRVFDGETMVDEWNDFNFPKIHEWHQKAVDENAKN